ncbi:MAG TPA: PilZ domain-containing protein [Polyangiaceae bacterium]|nr:PilZ domain-containing protein [Polyangiaceae bacterium]
MKNRRSLTAGSEGSNTPGEVHAMRRGDPRREVASRVTLTSPTSPACPLEGWALNVSRGGVRVILEHRVELGAEYQVALAEDGSDSRGGPPVPRPGRIVWVQEEPDGVVAGIEFCDASVTLRAASSRPPDPA